MRSIPKQFIIYTVIIFVLILLGLFYYSTSVEIIDLDKQIKENEVKIRNYEETIDNLQYESRQKSIKIEELKNETKMNAQTIDALESEVALLDVAVHMIGIEDIETILLEYAQMKIDYQNLQEEYNQLLKKCNENP